MVASPALVPSPSSQHMMAGPQRSVGMLKLCLILKIINFNQIWIKVKI